LVVRGGIVGSPFNGKADGVQKGGRPRERGQLHQEMVRQEKKNVGGRRKIPGSLLTNEPGKRRARRSDFSRMTNLIDRLETIFDLGGMFHVGGDNDSIWEKNEEKEKAWASNNPLRMAWFKIHKKLLQVRVGEKVKKLL